MFAEALFTIAMMWKQCKCPSTEEWIKKIWYIYTMEYYAKERKNAVCSNMDGPRECHTERNVRREILCDSLHMWNLKRNDASEVTKQKETHRLRNQTYGCQMGRDS